MTSLKKMTAVENRC